MKHFKTLKSIFMTFAMVAILVSCGDDNDAPAPAEVSHKDIITNITSNIIVKTYSDLAREAENLLEKTKKFKEAPSQESLDDAKDAWVATRKPWEQSEGFLIGPVDTGSIDPAIDSWPVNVVDMDALLADVTNHPTITEQIVNQQIFEAKGFHLIEYLLWGLDGNREADSFTTRELEYLVAASENLKNKTTKLKVAWVADGGNYQTNFLTAGPASSGKYKSEKSALEDLVSALIVIADEVGNGKIEVPLNGDPDTTTPAGPEQEESRFSHNSKLDFADNLISIQNVYHGTYLSHDGKGIADIVKDKDAALHTKFTAEIIAAINAIEAINGTGTFTDALANARPSIEAAQTAVRTVQATLESKIKPLISGL